MFKNSWLKLKRHQTTPRNTCRATPAMSHLKTKDLEQQQARSSEKSSWIRASTLSPYRPPLSRRIVGTAPISCQKSTQIKKSMEIKAALQKIGFAGQTTWLDISEFLDTLGILKGWLAKTCSPSPLATRQRELLEKSTRSDTRSIQRWGSYHKIHSCTSQTISADLSISQTWSQRRITKTIADS